MHIVILWCRLMCVFGCICVCICLSVLIQLVSRRIYISRSVYNIVTKACTRTPVRHRWLPNTNCDRRTNVTPNLYILRFDLLRMQKGRENPTNETTLHTRTHTHTQTQTYIVTYRCVRQRNVGDNNNKYNVRTHNHIYNGKCSQCCCCYYLYFCCANVTWNPVELSGTHLVELRRAS